MQECICRIECTTLRTVLSSKNVALFIDGSPDSDAEKELKNILVNAGTNYIDEPYFVKCSIFGSKISLENRQDIVDWARKIQDIAVNK